MAEQEKQVVECWVLTEVIGRGSFATVWKAYHKDSAKEAAIKEINTERLNKKLFESLASEIAVLQRANHPNIVNLYETVKWPEKSRIFLVLEYCSGSDLSKYVKRNGRLSEAKASELMGQLCSGLKHLRGLNLMHRDLKPQNLLLSSADEKDAVLKIADFGFARDLSAHGLADTLCGSPLYMAPEILQYKQYDVKADLWSVGAVLFELVSGSPPFMGSNHLQLLKSIERTEARLPADLCLSDSCRDLLRCLLKKNPIERLSFEGLFAHPFITGEPMTRRTESRRAKALHLYNPQPGPQARGHAARPPLQARRQSKARPMGEISGDRIEGAVAAEGPEPGSSLEKEYVLIENLGGSPTSNVGTGDLPPPGPGLDAAAKPSPASPTPPDGAERKASIGSNDMFRQYAVKSSLKAPHSGADTDLLRVGPSPATPLKGSPTMSIQAPESKLDRVLLVRKCGEIVEAGAQAQVNARGAFVLYLLGAKLLEHCSRLLREEGSAGTSAGEDAGSEEEREAVQQAASELRAKVEDLLNKAQAVADGSLVGEGSGALPDAMELLYAEAIAVAKRGAVEEVMGNYTSSAGSYFDALNLLFFICTEAREVPHSPRLELSPQDQAKVQSYMHKIQERYKVCTDKVPANNS